MRSTPTEELFPFPHPQDCCQNAKSISSLQMMFTSIKGLTQLQTCKSSQRLSQGDGAVEVRGGHDVRNKTQMRASGEIRGGSQSQSSTSWNTVHEVQSRASCFLSSTFPPSSSLPSLPPIFSPIPLISRCVSPSLTQPDNSSSFSAGPVPAVGGRSSYLNVSPKRGEGFLLPL